MFLRHAKIAGNLCNREVLRRNTRLFVTSSVTSQKGSGANDPIQQMFVDKIREYAKKEKTVGSDKLVDASPDQQKSFDDELERLSRVFAAKGKDYTKFPEFSFENPKIENADMTAG